MPIVVTMREFPLMMPDIDPKILKTTKEISKKKIIYLIVVCSYNTLVLNSIKIQQW